jgi:acyl carrier protein
MLILLSMEKKLFTELEDILELELGTIKESDVLRDFDHWDSMANLSVIAMLDDSFGFVIDSKDFKNLITVEDLIIYTKKRLA